jgi:hypothetical protein
VIGLSIVEISFENPKIYKSWDFKNLPLFIGVSLYSFEGTIETL